MTEIKVSANPLNVQRYRKIKHIQVALLLVFRIPHSRSQISPIPPKSPIPPISPIPPFLQFPHLTTTKISIFGACGRFDVRLFFSFADLLLFFFELLHLLPSVFYFLWERERDGATIDSWVDMLLSINSPHTSPSLSSINATGLSPYCNRLGCKF